MGRLFSDRIRNKTEGISPRRQKLRLGKSEFTLNSPIPRSRSNRKDATISIQKEYLVDEAGNRKAVVLPLDAWQQIKEELEELDDIRAYDEAKARPSEPLTFEQAMREIHEGKVD